MTDDEGPFVQVYVRLAVRRVLKRFGETTDDPDEGLGYLWRCVL